MAEKLCLQWNDFKENVNSAFRNLRKDKDFSDVTLACEDGQQVEAHKVILAASSPFFKNILKMNKNPHPLIYMRGMKSEDLVAIVDFLYYGEAEIEEKNLDTFLAVAEDLKVTGLTSKGSTNEKDLPSKKAKDICEESKKAKDTFEESQNAEERLGKLVADNLEDAMVNKIEGNGGESESEEEIVETDDEGVVDISETDDVPEPLMETLKTDNVAPDPFTEILKTDDNEPEHLNEPKRPQMEMETDGEKVAKSELPDEIADDIGTKVRSMMDFSENMVMSTKKPGATLGRARLCKMCGKEGAMGAILIHIENNHIAKVPSPCDVCGMISKSRNGLMQHKAKKHSNQ